MVAQRRVGPAHAVLTLTAPATVQAARPGQFLHVRCGRGDAPLLRRPFSLHRLRPERGELSLLYEIKGEGTTYLASLRSGETLDWLGPLGQGFPQPPPGRPAVLVGGGIGVAPLLALGEALSGSGHPVLALVGARTHVLLLALEDFAASGVKVRAATDDGSAGHHGPVTDLLPGVLSDGATVYACGPEPMLAKVKGLCADHGVPAFLSLEARLACGVGACLGCAVPATAGGYLKVCKDGPVFPAGEVLL